MPDTVLITIITQVPLRETSGLERLFNALEQVSELVPTHWGPDERARNAYVRRDVIESVSGFGDDYYVPGIRRQIPPRYNGYFSARNSGLKDVKLEFSSGLRQKDLQLIFRLGDALANELTPEFGLIHMIWRLGEKSQHYSEVAIIRADELQACGPPGVCTCTWFGPHITDLIGRERILNAGVPSRETDWGGIQIDLAEAPWNADFETLRASQEKVMDQLLPSGVFGDYSDPVECKPGPKWQPIPTNLDSKSV